MYGVRQKSGSIHGCNSKYRSIECGQACSSSLKKSDIWPICLLLNDSLNLLKAELNTKRHTNCTYLMPLPHTQNSTFMCPRIIIVILIYNQKDTTLHSLFYLETALHVSGGTSTHPQERKQLYLQHLVFVRPLLLPATIVEELELI